MKTTIKNFAILLAAVAPMLTACQSEPSVGDTLYPTEEETYAAKVYINEPSSPNNTETMTVVQTPVATLLPSDTVSFYVKLTQPVATDVTVTVAESDELAAAYGNNTTALGAGSLQLLNATVTIPAGSTTSTDAVRAVVAASDGVKSLSGNGVAALGIKEVTGGVAQGQNYNGFYVVLNKKVTNFKGQDAELLTALTPIATDDYTVDAYGENITELSDGDTETTFGYDGSWELTVTFASERSLSAVAIFAGYYGGYCPRTVDILTSSDGENWTSQTGGKLTGSVRPRTLSTPVPFVFYSAIKCRYVKLRLYDCFYSDYGSDYDYPCMSEMKFYE